MPGSMISRRAIVVGGLLCGAALAVERPKIIVTGDAGTVGGRLKPLLEPEYQIVGVDKKRGIDQDLAQSIAWAEAAVGAEALVHLAWDIARYDTYAGFQYNISITRFALSAARAKAVGRFIFASSAWAAPGLYGKKTGKEPMFYTESKLFVENLLRDFTRETGIPTAAIRFGAVHVAGSTDRPPDPDFDDRIIMTDNDLGGLFAMSMNAKDSCLLGPFDARASKL